MSVLTPPRESAASRRRAPAIEALPLRNPDTASSAVMGRRAWWLVGMNLLVPGSAQILAGNRRLGRFALGATLALWVGVALAVAASLLWRPVLYTLATNWFALTAAQVLLIGYAVLWVVLAFDTLRLVRLVKLRPLARIGVAMLACALMVATSGSALYAAHVSGVARDTLGSIFGAGGPPVEPTDGYYNILLLGADPDKGRDSMRPDSISVVSVNATSGAVTIIGLPRDTVGVPFAEGPMNDLFPDGYQGSECQTAHCGLNEIFTEVEVLRDGTELYPDAEEQGSTPGIEAMKDAAAGYLGIAVPYYVLIDMHGFAALVDALGGVDITVKERLPMGALSKNADGSLSGVKGWIEKGRQHMDGETAQWYARSRYTTSDWDRMKRQRQLQAAILKQFTPENVLARFQEVAAAGEHLVQTDIPQSMLPYLAQLAVESKKHKITRIELTPEGGVDPDNPDVAFVRELVDEALHPPSPSPTP
ncbi:MAG: LCP family protein [Microbacterium sp.]|uniref:LCP family protein n=1 Tax=Microbacterium sp. TaxID=51671 RepID=UPI0039E23777